MRQIWMGHTKIITLLGLLLVQILAPLSGLGVAHASGGLTFSEFATHPYASKTGYDQTSVNYYNGSHLCPLAQGQTTSWCPDGETINDMALTSDNKIIAGYGNWGSNVDSFGVAAGGVYVAPIDAATGQWDNTSFRIGSEAMDTISEIGGNIYIAQTDPSDRAPTGYVNGNTFGIITNKGGTWHMLRILDSGGAQPSFEHFFDVSSFDNGGNDLWVFGSICLEWGCNNDQAAAYRSTDGGVTWSLGYGDISTGTPNGFERYYWGHELNGKIYSQAQQTSPATPMRVFDSATNTASTWGTAAQNICNIYAGKYVEKFDGKLVCPGTTFGYINTFDGTTVQSIQFSTLSEGVNDFYVGKDGYLYMLTSGGNIYRANSLSGQWQLVGKAANGVPGRAASILVYNNYIYIGGDLGKIYRSDTTISSMPPIVPSITSTSRQSVPMDGRTYGLRLSGVDFVSGAIISVDGVVMTTIYESITSLVAYVDTSKLSISGQATSKIVDLVATNPNGEGATLPGSFTLVRTEPVVIPPTDPATTPDPAKYLTYVDFSKNPVSTTKTRVAAAPSGVSKEIKDSTFSVNSSIGCSGLSTISLLPSAGFAAPNPTYKTLGGVDFEISCGTTGGGAPVVITLGTTTLSDRDIRIYKKNSLTGAIQDITSKVSITTSGGHITVSYTPIDGGAYDDDGQANGLIVDPIYVVAGKSSDTLARTGENAIILVIVAASAIGISQLLLRNLVKRKKQNIV